MLFAVNPVCGEQRSSTCVALLMLLLRRPQEITVWHPGTIWLGRLDETEYILRAGKGSVVVRNNEQYYLPKVGTRSWGQHV